MLKDDFESGKALDNALEDAVDEEALPVEHVDMLLRNLTVNLFQETSEFRVHI